MIGLIFTSLAFIATILSSSAFNITRISSLQTSVTVGETFQLMCTVNSWYEWCTFIHNEHICDFEWKRSINNVTMLECDYYLDRVRFFGKYEDNECGIEITEAREEDGGQWVCAIEKYKFGRSRHYYEDMEQTMTVTVEPQQSASSSCEKDWIRNGGSCYRIFPEKKSKQMEAQRHCLHYNSNLVTVETQQENNFVISILSRAQEMGLLGKSQDIWLGARRSNQFSPFAWKSLQAGPRQLMAYSDWGDLFGNPGDALDTYYGHPALCVQMFKNSNLQWRWGVSHCDGHDIDNGFICEKILQGAYGSRMEPSHEPPAELKPIVEKEDKGFKYLRLSSTGSAGVTQSQRMGLYERMGPHHNGTSPVYKKLEGDQYIYLGPDDSWRVGPNTRSLEDTGIKSPRILPVPPSPPSLGWQLYDGDWHKDPTIQLKPATVEYFKLITNGTAKTIQPQRFGIYKLIQQNESSFPLYAKLGQHQQYLFVQNGYWMVGPIRFMYSDVGIKHLERTLEPTKTPPSKRWTYWDSMGWKNDSSIQFLPTSPEWSSWSDWSSCSRLCGGGNKTRLRICSAGGLELNICTGNRMESSSCNSDNCPESLQNGGDCSSYGIDNLPHPRIVVLGPPAVGKSTLSNFLLGVDPNSPDAPFLVSNPKASDTGISWRSGPWLGTGSCFTIIDTPSPAIGGRDHQHAASLMQFINDEIKSVDVFLILFNVEHSIMTSEAVRQLKLYENVLGKGWWDHVITQMTHWSHSARAVRRRKRKHLNETIMHQQLNEKYKELLNVSVPEIPTTFIDPILPVFVNEPEYDDYDIDESEMTKYLIHSQNLLNYAKKMKPFRCGNNCRSPEGYFTGQPLIQANQVSANLGEQVRIQCQIFIGHHKQNSRNITWTLNGEEIYKKITTNDGNIHIDKNVNSRNISFKVKNEFLMGSEDIFFSYLIVKLSNNSIGEYKCENGIASDKNIVTVDKRTGTWSSWSSWSTCSKSCDGGNQTRTRSCIDQHLHQCPGESLQQKECNNIVCVNFHVSLIGGKGPHEGNVIVVNSEGYKGPVCDDPIWDMDAANVVCRQLGYPKGAIEATTQSQFGDVNHRMAMDGVRCTGNEKHIQDCDYSTKEDCGSGEGAGVICQSDITSSSVMSDDVKRWGSSFAFDGSVSTGSEGFFQSKHELYPWLQIHLPTRFPLMVSQVNLINRVDSNGDLLKNIEVRAGMEKVDLGFTAKKILVNEVCGHFTGPGDNGGEIVVKCDPPIQSNYITIQKLETGILHVNEVKANPTFLVGGKISNEGNVMVNRYGKYGPICDDTWSIHQANVVCKEMGFKGGAEIATKKSHFGNLSSEYVMDDVWCEGSEDRIDDCTHLLTHDCGPMEAAGVVCKDNEGHSRTEGKWEQWTPCSKTCAGGSQSRKRICESKSQCPFLKTVTEERTCNSHLCPGVNTTDWRVPCRNPCTTKACKQATRKIKSLLDDSVDPCWDFHKFACGRRKRIKLKKPTTTFSSLVKNAPPEFKFIKDFYKSCVNVTKAGRTKNGVNVEFYTYAKKFVKRAKWPVIVGSDWEQEVHDWFGSGWTWYDFAAYVLANEYYVGSVQYLVKDLGVYHDVFLTSAFFSPVIDVAVNLKRLMEKGDSSSRIHIVPITVPEFLKSKDQTKIAKYKKVMKNLVKQLGAEEGMAERDMERVIRLEIELAEMTQAKYTTENDWEEISLTKLSQLLPSVPWLHYINKAFNTSAVRLERGTSVLIPSESLIVKIGKWIDTVSYRDQANLITWRMFAKFTNNFLNDGSVDLEKGIFDQEEDHQDCIQDGKFQSGNELGSLEVKSSVEECMADCKTMAGCVAITWNKNLKVCTFHSSVDKSRIYHKSVYIFAITACEDEKRSENCLSQINTFFPKVKDDLFIAQNLKKSELDDIKQLFEEVKKEFGEMIKENDWMDEKTKWYALDKLRVMKAHIGEKHLKSKNMNELTNLVTDNKYMENIIAIGNYFWKNVILEMKNPKDLFTDESKNNAYYAPYANEIQINTGLLKDFGYNIGIPRPIIYGGCVGSTLGHELTHGFDDKGKLRGKYGNLFSWWEPSAEIAFKAKTACMINQYDNFKIIHAGKTYSTNGTLTLDENISDNGGIKLGYRTFMKYLQTHSEACLQSLDFTPKQLFWIGWAQDWCRFNYDTYQYMDGGHAAAPWRVNTVFSNMPEFATDFSCPVGAKLNPETRCSVW